MNEKSGQRQVSQVDIDFVDKQLNGGATAEAVRDRLVERGMAADDALSVLSLAHKRATVYDGTIALLNQGYSPNAVKEQLVAKGWGRPTAEFIVGDILARNLAQRRGRNRVPGKLAGGVTFLVGVGLWIGNFSGAFTTFPFAGFILMGIGGFILGKEESKRRAR